MRLDTIIIMPPYAAAAAAAAAILDNAMGVVHFRQAREEADDGIRQTAAVGGYGTNLFLCGQLLPTKGERKSERRRYQGRAECALLRAQIDRLGRF